MNVEIEKRVGKNIKMLRERADLTQEEVAAATGHMHQRPFLAQAQAWGHHQHQRDSLDQQGPLAQVAPDDEATQDGLYLKHRMEKVGEWAAWVPLPGK